MPTTHRGLFKTATTLILGAALATLTVGCDGAGETIGPRGGSLTSQDGRFSVDVPSGALDSEIELSIEEVECELSTTLGACYAVLPLGTTFLLPAEIAYEVADMDVTEDVGVVAQAADGWRVLPDRDVDLEGAVVYGSALYLSEYGLANVE
ncbi:MAG: hypothetical protein KUG77_09715 [Nannocystaceae bacterium]|nr:hypothetical protein [Nannocystaceae bacterium]